MNKGLKNGLIKLCRDEIPSIGFVWCGAINKKILKKHRLTELIILHVRKICELKELYDVIIYIFIFEK